MTIKAKGYVKPNSSTKDLGVGEPLKPMSQLKKKFEA
jgi:hypothetical protein